MRTNWLGRILLAISMVVAVGVTSANAEESATISKPIDGSSVGIQMFGWNWNSLATECTNHLGPNGYDWILTLPPQESKKGPQWWTHYQPISYKLDSSAGTREQFSKMVAACNAAGVKVITDAVINHMAGGMGTDFPGLYTSSDFHSGLAKTDPHFCDVDIVSWDAFDERTNCQFPGLPDLATEKDSVRKTIAAFLNDQLSLGVSGFRIDAAKHIQPADIAAIKKLLIRDAYIVQEVPGDTSLAEDYLGTGDVWAWKQQLVSNNMFSIPGNADNGRNYEAATKLYTPSAQSLTWISNHDTDHHGGSLSYSDGRAFQLASAWLLAEPYGKPMIYSGYTYFDDSADAPLDSAGKIRNARCASVSAVRDSYPDGFFTCVQRWTSLAGMIAWRDTVGAAAKGNVVTKFGVYGFSRGKLGYVLFNSNTKTFSALKLKTGLPAGTYCNLYVGGKNCKGNSVVIAKDGTLTVKVPAQSAIAISTASKKK
jgi:alpha-amylase